MFIKARAASLEIAAEESCVNAINCVNKSGSFNSSSRPSVVPVTPDIQRLL